MPKKGRAVHLHASAVQRLFVSHDGLTMSGLNVAETNRPVCFTDSPRVVVLNQEKSRAHVSHERSFARRSCKLSTDWLARFSSSAETTASVIEGSSEEAGAGASVPLEP